MLNKPSVQTYFSGNEEYARHYLPEAFRLLENYLRSASARGDRLAIDKFQRHLKGATITVTLHHRLHLSVPYANRLFGEPLDGAPGHYATEVVVRYTLVNQGRYDNMILEFVPGTGRPGELMIPR